MTHTDPTPLVAHLEVAALTIIQELISKFDPDGKWTLNGAWSQGELRFIFARSNDVWMDLRSNRHSSRALVSALPTWKVLRMSRVPPLVQLESPSGNHLVWVTHDGGYQVVRFAVYDGGRARTISEARRQADIPRAVKDVLTYVGLEA